MQTSGSRERVERAAAELWDTETAAAYLHVSAKTLQRWRKAGRLQGLKAGQRILYRPDDVRSQVRPEPGPAGAEGSPKSVNAE